MSESAAGKPEFTDLWRNAVRLCDRKTQDKRIDTLAPVSTTSAMCKDLQSPQGRGCSRYPGLNNGDSPGDVEPSQDIFWDSTSPTPANTRPRNTRVVKISDIVDRIAPKDVKRKGTESPLLQWICDSAIPCTPNFPRPRVRKKYSRQNSVDDLVKLARQFDKNMEDNKTSEECHTDNNNLTEDGNTPKTHSTETSFPGAVKDLKCPSSPGQVEAELNALFDCSTQRVSGPLSQGSVSAPSQEVRVPAAHPGQGDGSCSRRVNNNDFDDDWENDDLLNDSFVLAMTQNPDQNHDTTPKSTMQVNTETNASEFTSAYKPSNKNSAQHQPADLHSKPSCSTLQELCFKPKTTGRSTFKLGPTAHIQPKAGTKESSCSSFTVIQTEPRIYKQKPATTKTLSTPHPDKIANDPRETSVAACIHIDSLWDDGDDNALLYQVCDRVERISNSQPQLGRASNCHQNVDAAVDAQRGTTTPLPIDTAWSLTDGARASRQSPPRAVVCSNSLPGTSCEAVNYQGWNTPMIGANSHSRLSQSLPGNHTSLGTFSQCRGSSGGFHTANATVDKKPHTVTARGTHKSHQTAFKRNLSDSAVMSNKVFVTSQMTGKCSAAEIERKKQEALARRRLRMQNVAKK